MEGTMAYAQSFFGWLLQTTLVASLVICMILLIQQVLGRKLGPRWSHALWLILLIRMVLPWSPSSRVSLSNMIPTWQRQTQSLQLPDSDGQQNMSIPTPIYPIHEAMAQQEPQSELAAEKQIAPVSQIITNAKAQSGPLLVLLRRILPMLWLAGAILIGTYLLFCDLALWRIVKRDRPLIKQAILELFEECKSQMDVQSLVVVVPSDQVRSPGLFGFVRPRLLLPKKMLDDAKPEELRYVFLHELAHLKRHDIYIGWLTSLLQVLHWFNPLVWFAFYRMRTDRELACDALVLTQTGQDKSQEYGGAIVDLLHRFSRPRHLPAMAGIVESKSQLKRRITMITQFKNKSYRFSPLAAVLIIVLACISLPDAINTKASESSTATSMHQLNFRKITIPTKPGGGVLSPDGEKLAFVYEGSLWIVPVHGNVSPDIAGEPVRLTEPMGAWDVASMLAWSADGKWIAFNVSDEKEDAIYVIASSGGEPRRVPVEPRLRNSVPNYRLSLSPDGKVVAFSSRYIDESGVEPPEESGLPPSVRGFFIYTATVAGGELKRLTDSASGEPAFSPDGKKIAFVKYFISEQGQLYSSLWVVPATGGSPIQVSDSDPLRRVCGPVWSPDGKMIAFTVRTPSERKEVCVIPVSEAGMALASPTKIRLPLNTLDMLAGWTHDNKIGVFLHKPGQWAINTIPASGGQAVQVTPSGSAAHPRWSPDGQRIYFRWDGGQMASVPSSGGALSIGPFNRDETFYLIYPGSGNAVSPDGKEVVFCAGKKVSEDNKKPYWEVNIYTISLEGGEPKKITEGRYPCWSPDGKSIAFIRTYQRPVKSESGWNIYIVPSKGGEVRQLTSDSDNVRRTHIDFSPDGKSIAYFAKDKTIRVIPVQGGESRIVAGADELRNYDELDWSPDGKKLVYSSKGCIWMVSSEGGEPKEIRTGLDVKAGQVSWSPDGKKLAFTAITSGEEDLYLIENFLSEAPVAKPSYQTNFKKIQIHIDRLRPDAPLSPDGRNIAFVFNKKLWVMPRVGNAGPDFPGTPRLLETGDIKVSWGGETWSGDSRWIAFHDTDQWNEEKKSWGNRAVYVISVDGGEPKEVYEDWSYGDYLVNVRMSLSPDGKILAFSSVDANEQHIYTIDVEGGLPKRIVEASSREPVFSPDGKMIAYVEDVNLGRSGGGLWIVPSDGGNPELVANAGNATKPVWSPDGSMIAFLDQTTTDKIFIAMISENGEDTAEKITIDCPDGLNPVLSLSGWTPDNKLGTMLVSDPQDGLYTLPATGGIVTLVTNERLNQPRWSPDGKRIVGTIGVGEGKEGWKYDGLAWVSAEGGEISIIPVKSDSKIIKLSYSGGNHVSPDGKSIVFAGRKEQEPEGINHIWTIPIEGGEPKQLTNSDLQKTDRFPCWSPDGNNIAFMRSSEKELIEDKSTDTDIYIISVDGGELRQLTHKSDKVLPSGYIDWSPDGKWISYFSADMEVPNSDLTLNVIPAEGGTSRVVGKPVGSFDVRIETAWSPDSKQIAIVHNEIKIISLDDGSIEEINTHLTDTDIDYLDWTDNGNRLVFSGRQGGGLEFWTVENFLPEEISRQP